MTFAVTVQKVVKYSISSVLGIALTCILLICTNVAEGQRILQSKEVNIRYDAFYDIFSYPSGRNLITRNQDNKVICELFDDELSYLRTADIVFETDRVSIETIFMADSLLHILYSYRMNDRHFINMRSYNDQVALVDTVKTIFEGEKKPFNGTYKVVLSDNKEHLALFGSEKEEMFFLTISVKKATIEKQSSFLLKDIDPKDDLRKVILTDAGEIAVVFEQEERSINKEAHKFIVYESTTESDFFVDEISFEGKENTGVKVTYSKPNNEIIIAGLYTEGSDILGHFGIFYKLGSGEHNTVFNPFSQALYGDLFGKSQKKNLINDFSTKDVILRQDGGYLIISESQREYIRRPNYGMMRNDFGPAFGSNGSLVDYYHEDLIVTSVNPDGSESWYKILYKKQFSQDDSGIYSSYFTLKTPSRMHFLYNDEIKKNSTVSEYIISPSGKFERRAVLNTEYQDMNLRFRDAIQTSSTEILVPSEKNLKLSLVKISI